MQQAVHDRDDEYGPSQARGGEINTHTWICEQGAACACSAVDIWGSAWATLTDKSREGKGLSDSNSFIIIYSNSTGYIEGLEKRL